MAFVFIVTLGCFMLGRRRTDCPPVRRPKKKKRKRVKCNTAVYTVRTRTSGPQKKTMTTNLITVVAPCSGRIFNVTS